MCYSTLLIHFLEAFLRLFLTFLLSALNAAFFFLPASLANFAAF